MSELSLNDEKSFNESLIYILESDLNYEYDKVDILLIGDFESKLILNLQKIADKINSNKFKVINNNIFKLNNESEVVTITGLEITRKDQYAETAKKLKIRQKNVRGNIVLKDLGLPKERKDEIELAIIKTALILNNLKKELKTFYRKYTLKYFNIKSSFTSNQ